MKKLSIARNPANVTDRRSGDDRRSVEGKPPSKHERRRSLESRQPEVVELDMSNSEWAALSERPPQPSK